MNRSQFFSTAASRYADEVECADITAAIDAALGGVASDEGDASTRFAVAAGQRILAGDDEQW